MKTGRVHLLLTLYGVVKHVLFVTILNILLGIVHMKGIMSRRYQQIKVMFLLQTIWAHSASLSLKVQQG